MRICLLSLTYPPANTEGISRQRKLLAEELSRLGHDVHVVTIGKAEGDRFVGGIQIHEVVPNWDETYSSRGTDVNASVALSIALYRGLTEADAIANFDIVDVPLWNSQGFIALTKYQKPIVVWLQTTLAQILRIQGKPVTNEERLRLSLDKICLDHASGILADSQAIIRSVNSDYGMLPTIPVGISYLGMSPISNAQIVLPTGQPCEALVVGRLEQRKGTHLLFDLLPEVLSNYPDLKVRFVGQDNSAYDGWQREHGASYVDTFKQKHPEFEGRVIFEGYVSEEKLAEYYQQAAFLLVPSIYESFGLIYLEAMRYRLPVITFAIEAAKEIFPEGEADGAILIPEGDLEAFGAAIGRLIEHPEIRSELGEGGLRRFLDRFTTEKMAESTADFYQKILEAWQARKPRADIIYQVMEALDSGDAVSTIALKNAEMLGEDGQPAVVLARDVNPEIDARTKPIRTALTTPECGLIFHYWGYNSSTWVLRGVHGPKALYYHNITPPRYFPYRSLAYERTTQGYAQIAALVNDFDLLIGVSAYNLEQLVPFLRQPKPGIVIHPVIEADDLQAEPFERDLYDRLRQSGCINILFVGRIARNKRQDQLIRLYHDYASRIDRKVNLWLVGSDATDPMYRAELEAQRLSVTNPEGVTFTGKVSRAQLLAYYRAADVFVSASEHEGFGVPIAEAMAFDVPVIGYAAAAVPETMGEAGILVNEWRPGRLSQLISRLVRDRQFRSTTVTRQRDNLKRFSASEARQRLSSVIRYMHTREIDPTSPWEILNPEGEQVFNPDVPGRIRSD